MARIDSKPITTKGSKYPGIAPLKIAPTKVPIVIVASINPILPPILPGRNRFDIITILETMNRLSPRMWNNLITSTGTKVLTNNKFIWNNPERNIPR